MMIPGAMMRLRRDAAQAGEIGQLRQRDIHPERCRFALIVPEAVQVGSRRGLRLPAFASTAAAG